ncbi:barstar family protein [Commensalibacter nepenthis]|uniref:Barstar family protein n=1 Tax=Commensalibacter nepenthis TaxID=3043872 RepID=A0ABT6Q5M9_9PROT|nr:barstar family protein [Commensalibacter sp. TBRC 10068]MDI2112204.1 barstar family protein [Commensalibacter sp. TBRC 10068]
MIKEYKNLLQTHKSFEEIWQFVLDIKSNDKDSVVLICRGDRMKVWKTFCDEISAVLQFPYYYSGAEGSFDECICDLAWIFEKRIFVFFTNADKILSEESYNFLSYFEKSSIEVPIDSMKYDNEEKHVYYIFQNIDQDFPLFEDKELSDFI